MNERVAITIDRGVADVRLTRSEKMNALDSAMFAALADAIERLGSEYGLRAVVLSGEGRAFCAGLDMASMAAGGGGAPLEQRTHGNANLFQQVAWGWRTLPVPVIVAVHGAAMGGGLQLMAGADIRIAAPDTRFSIMELRWGIVPDMAGFALWRGQVRDDTLRLLTYTAREFDSTQALDHGFVTQIADDPHAGAMALAHEIAGRNPHAVRAAKRLANAARDSIAEEILAAESAEQASLLRSPNQMEAVAANLQRRAPVFTD